jgi:hypothetical protein
MSENESRIIKPREIPSFEQTTQGIGGTMPEIRELLAKPVAVAAGILLEYFSHGTQALKAPLVRGFQGMLTYGDFSQFFDEFRTFQKQGELPSNFGEKRSELREWVELLTIIDEERPDEEKLEALKAMFFAANKISADDGEKIAGHELFRIAKRLDSNQILVLKAAHEKFDADANLANERNYAGWARLMAQHLGHSLTGLIDRAEAVLVEQCLLTPRLDQGLKVSPLNGRLTDLGVKFCENIRHYQIAKQKLD